MENYLNQVRGAREKNKLKTYPITLIISIGLKPKRHLGGLICNCH